MNISIVRHRDGNYRCSLEGYEHGATIYVVRSGSEFHIRAEALRHEDFGEQNESLLDYVQRYGCIKRQGAVYALPIERLLEVLNIFLAAEGMP